jgi:hypothetical protein
MWLELSTQFQNYDYSWSDVVGNTGVALLLINLYLNVEGKIDSKGLAYNINNLLVAILLTVNLIYKPNISSLIIEFFWAAISIRGIYNYYKSKNQT